MMARLFNKTRILVMLVALVLVVLFTSGTFAQGTATIKALFTREAPPATVAPAALEQPDPIKQ